MHVQVSTNEVRVSLTLNIPYSGKFLRGPDFHDFRSPQPKCKNKNREIQSCEIWIRELLEIFTPCVLCTGLTRSDLWQWHYSTSAISSRQTTSYPFPRDIFCPLLVQATLQGYGKCENWNLENFFWRRNRIFTKIWTRKIFPLYGTVNCIMWWCD